MPKMFCPECGEDFDGKHCFECGFPHEEERYDEFGNEILQIFPQDEQEELTEKIFEVVVEELLSGKDIKA